MTYWHWEHIWMHVFYCEKLINRCLRLQDSCGGRVLWLTSMSDFSQLNTTKFLMWSRDSSEWMDDLYYCATVQTSMLSGTSLMGVRFIVLILQCYRNDQLVFHLLEYHVVLNFQGVFYYTNFANFLLFSNLFQRKILTHILLLSRARESMDNIQKLCCMLPNPQGRLSKKIPSKYWFVKSCELKTVWQY